MNTSVRRNATSTTKSIPHIRGDRVFAHMSTDYCGLYVLPGWMDGGETERESKQKFVTVSSLLYELQLRGSPGLTLCFGTLLPTD